MCRMIFVSIFTLYDVGDDVGSIADVILSDAELLPPVMLLWVLPPPVLLLFDDFFSLRDFPLDSPPPLCRELADVDCDEVIGLPPLLTPPIPSPPGNAAAKSGCGNPDSPDA